MVMSNQMLERYKRMPITMIDEQVLFLCKNGKYHGVIEMNTIYQQFKTAVALKDDEAAKVFRSILLTWVDRCDVEMLEFYASNSSENFSQAKTMEVWNEF